MGGTGRGEDCHWFCFQAAPPFADRKQRAEHSLTEKEHGIICEHTTLGLTVNTPTKPPQPENTPAQAFQDFQGKGQEAQPHRA